jgi:hypothetical protein
MPISSDSRSRPVGPDTAGHSAGKAVTGRRPWSQIDSVVLFRCRKRTRSPNRGWQHDIGVLLRPGSPGVPPTSFVEAVEDGALVEMDAFHRPELFAAFGLPPTL